ncbi:MAG TPA: FIST N-terminal domain-containing protein [Chloroflexota bacterium]|nr:FIST N-terminal domain-containing protein [Chloroflexota bacterium]
MTDAVTAQTANPDSAEAGSILGSQISTGLEGKRPDAVILFASSRFEYEPLLRALDEACQPHLLVGCSSAGEFTTESPREGTACAVALRSDDIRFSAGLGRDLRASRRDAARQIVHSFAGLDDHNQRHRSALVLGDALGGFTDELVEELTLLTTGSYQLFGGGAGDDAKFESTHVFLGTQAHTNAAVALEFLSRKPIGIGVGHGWQPASQPLRVTESEGTRLVSLNAAPTVEAFDEHAENTGQRLDVAVPLPFFLHNVIGIDTGSGHKLRVPLAAYPDGSVACASDVPENSTVHIMGVSNAAAVDAATRATRAAISQLGDHSPKVALFFDCVATRLRMGQEFGFELQSVRDALGGASMIGCNTYGQIARAEGQFSGFHNCTAVVCVIPE